MWRSRRVGRKDRQYTNIGDECESLLAGRYADHLRGRGRVVPAWAWLNQLSHGTAEELRALAASTTAGPADAEWHGAVGFLAAEVLGATGDGVSLPALQRDVLVPLELEMASRWLEPMTAAQLVTRVLAELDRSGWRTSQGPRGTEAA